MVIFSIKDSLDICKQIPTYYISLSLYIYESGMIAYGYMDHFCLVMHNLKLLVLYFLSL